MHRTTRRLLIVCALLVAAAPARAERLKDLSNMLGSRGNALLGYGLVVGLNGTGDDFYAGVGMQSVATMLRHLGVNTDPNNLRLRNVAAVMVTADLPAFVAPGQRIDVTVSSIGTARSLEGGTLVASPLKGADLKVYAVAQGPLAVGGYAASSLSGSRIQKNVTTVGRIPGGGMVERDIETELPHGQLFISLHAPDFTTAVRIARAIDTKLTASQGPAPAEAVVADANSTEPAPASDAANERNAANASNANNANAAKQTAAAKTHWAQARDAGTVVVQIPQAMQKQVPTLMADLEILEVTPDIPTRVVISERTGTVVLGDKVRLTPVAIAHGGLTLEVYETRDVSQPGPFSQGQTKVVPRSQITAQESPGELHALNPGTTLGDVVKALNVLGVAPRDLLSILQALKTSGALRAELEIQ